MQNGQTHTPKPTRLAQRRADAAERRAASADGRARETKAAEVRTAEALRDLAHLTSALADVRQDRDRWRALAERMAAATGAPAAVVPAGAVAEADATDDDLLTSYEDIGRHLRQTSRQAEHLAEIGAIPTFKLPGSSIVRARRSTLNAWFAEREAAALAATKQGGR